MQLEYSQDDIQKEIVALEEIYIHVPNVVSKLNTDKTYIEKDKFTVSYTHLTLPTILRV